MVAHFLPEPSERHFKLPLEVMEHLGYREIVVAGPDTPNLFNRTEVIKMKLYRNKDIACGGAIVGHLYFVRLPS